MNEPTAKTTSLTDERLAELLLVSPLGDNTEALLELQRKREFFADLADPQLTVCPHCLRVFQSQADLRAEAALRVARAAVNLVIRTNPVSEPAATARKAVMLAAAQIGLG